MKSAVSGLHPLQSLAGRPQAYCAPAGRAQLSAMQDEGPAAPATLLSSANTGGPRERRPSLPPWSPVLDAELVRKEHTQPEPRQGASGAGQRGLGLPASPSVRRWLPVPSRSVGGTQAPGPLAPFRGSTQGPGPPPGSWRPPCGRNDAGLQGRGAGDLAPTRALRWNQGICDVRKKQSAVEFGRGKTFLRSAGRDIIIRSERSYKWIFSPDRRGFPFPQRCALPPTPKLPLQPQGLGFCPEATLQPS